MKLIIKIFFVSSSLLFLAGLSACGEKKEKKTQDGMENMQGMNDMTGMKMERETVNNDTTQQPLQNPSLNDVLKPVNGLVLSSLPLITIQKKIEKSDFKFYGVVNYNEKGAEVISSRVSGRIEKLFVKYRFEKITKGEKLMEIYSPELVTAQQDLLFLLDNDSQNSSLIESGKQKLFLLGMSESQMGELIQNKKVINSITIYSNYSGHIHEASVNNYPMSNMGSSMNESTVQVTQPLLLKEGMYVQAGQPLLTIYDETNAWVLANIFPEQQSFIHTGDPVEIIPDNNISEKFTAKIDFVEPQYHEGGKTVSVRIYFNNAKQELPIGIRVKIITADKNIAGFWLPTSSILSLGENKVVFVKSGNGLIAKGVKIGYITDGETQILNSDLGKDSIVINAQYLIDSESFIKVKQ